MRTTEIAEFFDIPVIANSLVHYLQPSESGCSIADRAGKWTIIYDDTDTRGRIRFTIAHELGHILLGHELAAGFNHYRTIAAERPISETQADEFAVRLLAPACVLWALDAYSAADIEKICDISYTAAEFRARRMALLRQRGRFLSHPLEKQLYAAFLPWIEQQKNRP